MNNIPQLSILNSQRFISAGKAVFTIQNKNTGTRFTFKVRKSDDDRIYFISVLTSSDNNNGYRYLGYVFPTNMSVYVHGKKSSIDKKAPSAIYAEWLFMHLFHKAPNLHSAQIFHEGRCGSCGRKLTTPTSIEIGIGPICLNR